MLNKRFNSLEKDLGLELGTMVIDIFAVMCQGYSFEECNLKYTHLWVWIYTLNSLDSECTTATAVYTNVLSFAAEFAAGCTGMHRCGIDVCACIRRKSAVYSIKK